MIIMLFQFLKTSTLAQNEMVFCISQFLLTVFAYSHPRWDGFYDHIRTAPSNYIFDQGAFYVTSEFFQWFQNGLDVSILNRIVEELVSLFLWLSLAFVATIENVEVTRHTFQLNFTKLKQKNIHFEKFCYIFSKKKSSYISGKWGSYIWWNETF